MQCMHLALCLQRAFSIGGGWGIIFLPCTFSYHAIFCASVQPGMPFGNFSPNVFQASAHDNVLSEVPATFEPWSTSFVPGGHNASKSFNPCFILKATGMYGSAPN